LETKPWHQHYDHGVPLSIRYPQIPVQNMFYSTVVYYPKKAAVNFYGSELTFWQLREQMLRMANALGKMGIRKGDRVGLALPNCPQYMIAYLATLSLGAIVVNMNPLYTHDELKFMMETTGMGALITFDGALPTLRPLARELGLKHVVVTRLTDYIKEFDVSTAKSLDLDYGWHHFSALIAGSLDKRIPRIAIHPQDTAMIQFTGGTTGLPKGAMLTHANIVAATYAATLWGSTTNSFTLPESRSVLGVIPYFHIYGNIVSMNWGFFNAATQILLHRFDIEELLNTIAKFEQISFFPAVPTMITAIVNHPKTAEIELGQRLCYFNSGGAPMPTELIEQVRDMGIFFGEGYGMSESTALGISNPVMGLSKTGSIGIPYIDTDVRLVDLENGTEDVKPGEPGEIIMKSPFVMKGYWNNPEETAHQLKDGWLRTGDIARTDEDGYYYIVDRKKDMIIAGGFNIYPREVDEVLYRHPKISEAIAVGIPDAYRGETIKACVVLKPGAVATEKEIIAFCKEKLAPYKVPRIVEFRGELPKSAVGKILRMILRDEEIAKKAKK
jgi:long-chain acyl-CoA synthetase